MFILTSYICQANWAPISKIHRLTVEPAQLITIVHEPKDTFSHHLGSRKSTLLDIVENDYANQVINMQVNCNVHYASAIRIFPETINVRFLSFILK